MAISVKVLLFNPRISSSDSAMLGTCRQFVYAQVCSQYERTPRDVDMVFSRYLFSGTLGITFLVVGSKNVPPRCAIIFDVDWSYPFDLRRIYDDLHEIEA